ncbi:MAG: hypothetical protein KKH06_04355, partial [Gammaproteobacteria bacterium]|nr:hypothetical protein [Gammaproteobacteria bacterium]
MKKWSFLLSSLLISTAFATTPFYRFWRGYKSPHLTYLNFLEGMRNDFMSKTVTSAEHKGLIAYLPTLPPQHIALPDEIALVVYQTKAAYMKLLK